MLRENLNKMRARARLRVNGVWRVNPDCTVQLNQLQRRRFAWCSLLAGLLGRWVWRA